MLPHDICRCEGALNATSPIVCDRREDCERHTSLEDMGPRSPVVALMCFDDRYHGFIPVKVVA